MVHKHVSNDEALDPAYAGRFAHAPIPKNRMPDDESLPGAVYRMIHDELLLDGSSRLNMATFVTTWMEPEAEKLMAETFDKNMIDKDEYPQTAEIERRCVNIVADLFHAPTDGDAIGVSTIGSSEAVHARWARDEVEVAAAPRGRRTAHRQAEHGHGLQRPGRVGEVLSLLGRRAALRAAQSRPVHRRPRRRDGEGRREHDRRDPDPRHHLHRRVRADRRDPRLRRGLQHRARHRHPDPRRRGVAADSSPRSCTPISNGTSDSRRSSRSTCQGTSTD